MDNLEKQLDAIFKAFIRKRISNDALIEFQSRIDRQNIAILFDHVEGIGHPQDYCKSDNDQQTVEGFFLYIDFISALLIHLELDISDLSDYQHFKSDYVQWILRYVAEPRFHQEIMMKFRDVFA